MLLRIIIILTTKSTFRKGGAKSLTFSTFGKGGAKSTFSTFEKVEPNND